MHFAPISIAQQVYNYLQSKLDIGLVTFVGMWRDGDTARLMFQVKNVHPRIWHEVLCPEVKKICEVCAVEYMTKTRTGTFEIDDLS